MNTIKVTEYLVYNTIFIMAAYVFDISSTVWCEALALKYVLEQTIAVPLPWFI